MLETFLTILAGATALYVILSILAALVGFAMFVWILTH